MSESLATQTAFIFRLRLSFGLCGAPVTCQAPCPALGQMESEEDWVPGLKVHGPAWERWVQHSSGHDSAGPMLQWKEGPPVRGLGVTSDCLNSRFHGACACVKGSLLDPSFLTLHGQNGPFLSLHIPFLAKYHVFPTAFRTPTQLDTYGPHTH